MADISIHAWIQENKIKNEKGDLIDFTDHLYLYDIYADRSTDLVAMKAAQVGMSTLEVLKNMYDAKHQRLDIIYTMPTDEDVRLFVGGSVNRIIENNPILLDYTKDKDSIEQKSIGSSIIHFRGTWGARKAQSTPADRLVHDEIDTSKQVVIDGYQARLQHSKHKQTHVFSHPSFPGVTTDIYWKRSDQKHWFIKCPHCNFWQFLSWDLVKPERMSIDIEKRCFHCKKCRKVLSDQDRRDGQWVAKYPGRAMSGYWIPLLIAPYISADYIINKFNGPKAVTPFEFSTKVIGKPHNDSAAKLLRKHFMQNLTGSPWAPPEDARVIIGIDTGLRLDFVMGTKDGLFFQGDTDKYETLDGYMRRWPKAIAVIDAGGDLIGSRAFAARWVGRVFLCYLTNDRKKNELLKWGEGDEHGAVSADRDRMIQLVVGEFRDRRLPVHGTEDDWYEYYTDWANLTRIEVLDKETGVVKGRKWVRSGRDHRALATVFFRVGVSRFATGGSILAPTEARKPNSYMMSPDGTVSFNPEEMFDLMEDQEQEWNL